MKKLLTAFFIALFLTIAPRALADSQFNTQVAVTYTVNDDGSTTVLEDIKLINTTAFYYTPSYTMNLGVEDADDIIVKNSHGDLPFETHKNDQGVSIKTSFPDRIVGVGKVNEFFVTYTTHKIAQKMGDIWQISIPGLEDPDSFSQYQAKISYPASFGNPSTVKPAQKDAVSSPISFSKDEIGKAGALLLFGKDQYFTLSLVYHISNRNFFPIQTEIALPPDTGYQRVIIPSMSEKPLNTYQDQDGNWLATYSLGPQEQKTITMKMLVKVTTTANQESLSNAQRKEYLQPQPYWEVNNQKITDIVKTLQSPQDIYNYVVSHLSYDYGKTADETIRLGAVKALENPTQSVCLEFTDLFVALARAKGIPARSVEGYAYTEDSTLRPVSLVQDVLHAWPEYYDDTQKKWIMVDPTWGNTTNGIDYFSSFDLSHIAFVVKGKDSSYPIPAGGYKFNTNSRDVTVSFMHADQFVDTKKNSVSFDFSSHALAGLPIHALLTIQNTSGSPIKNADIIINSPLSPKTHSIHIDALPPYGKKVYQVSFHKTPLLTNKDYTITIHFDGKTYNKSITVTVVPNLWWLLLGGGIIGACFVLSRLTYKTWRLYIQKRKK